MSIFYATNDPIALGGNFNEAPNNGHISPELRSNGYAINYAYSGFIHIPAYVGDTLWIHVMWRTDSFNSGDDGSGGPYVYFDDNNILHYMNVSNGYWNSIFRGNSDIATSPHGSLNSINYFDIMLKKNGDNTWDKQIYINEVLHHSVTNQADTRNSGNPAKIQLVCSDGGNHRWSELIFSTTPTVGLRMIEFYPEGVGFHNDFVGGFPKINQPQLFDAILSNTNGNKFSSLPRTWDPSESRAVAALVTETYTEIDPTASVSQIQHFLRVGGVDYPAPAPVTIPQSQLIQTQEIWTTNPATALPWSVADLNAAENGIEVLT